MSSGTGGHLEELALLARATALALERERWRGRGLRVARRPEPRATTRADQGVRAGGAAGAVASAPAPAAAPDSSRGPSPGSSGSPAGDNQARAAACADLASLRELVAGCTECSLCEKRTQTVFGDGSEEARVLFVGEAPGEHEDRKGVPFVGRAGELLTDIITKGMGLRREEVYIANVLKCRPPGNRDPSPLEKELCTPFLDRQIELLRPEVLITLGLHATQHVLGSRESMGRLRGRIHLRGETKVVATYHPAFLLRSPGMKKECWKDIQLAMRELGLSPSERGGGSGGAPKAGAEGP